MTPNTRLHELDAAIAACALDAMLGEHGRSDDRSRNAAPPASGDDGVPEASYDDVEIERRTWAYRRR